MIFWVRTAVWSLGLIALQRNYLLQWLQLLSSGGGMYSGMYSSNRIAYYWHIVFWGCKPCHARKLGEKPQALSSIRGVLLASQNLSRIQNLRKCDAKDARMITNTPCHSRFPNGMKSFLQEMPRISFNRSRHLKPTFFARWVRTLSLVSFLT